MLDRRCFVAALMVCVATGCADDDEPVADDGGDPPVAVLALAPSPLAFVWNVSLPYRSTAGGMEGGMPSVMTPLGDGGVYLAATTQELDQALRVQIAANGSVETVALDGLALAYLAHGNAVVGRTADGRTMVRSYGADGAPVGDGCGRSSPWPETLLGIGPGGSSYTLWGGKTIMGCGNGTHFRSSAGSLADVARSGSNYLVSSGVEIDGVNHVETISLLNGGVVRTGWPRVYTIGGSPSVPVDTHLFDSDDTGDKVFVVGASGAECPDPSKCDGAFLARFAGNGVLEWQQVVDRAGQGTPQRVLGEYDGESLVASAAHPGGSAVFLRTHDTLGIVVAELVFEPRAGADRVEVREMTRDSDGYLYVAGNSRVGGEDHPDWDAWISVFSPDNVLLGTQILGGSGQQDTLLQLLISSSLVRTDIFVATRSGQGLVVKRFARDSDGDGMPDEWERDGVDGDGDGEADLKLPDAHPDRPDVYLEYDTMAFGPGMSLPGRIVPVIFANVFVELQVLFEDGGGKRPMELHVRGDFGTIADNRTWHDPDLEFRAISTDLFGAWVTPDTILTTPEKARAAARKVVRHLAFIDRIEILDENGVARYPSGVAERWGNDLVVAVGNLGVAGKSNAWMYDALMGTTFHELGHSLGLHHGGADADNYKPTYHSVMNYAWQMPQCWEMPSGTPSEPGDCPAGTHRSYFNGDLSSGEHGQRIDERDLRGLTHFNGSSNLRGSWVPVGPPMGPPGARKLQLVPEGRDALPNTPVWILLYLGTTVGPDGTLHRDLNHQDDNAHDLEQYGDHDDWSALNVLPRTANWAPHVHVLNADANSDAPIEIDARCGDPYYGDPAFGPECACTAGETRACGGPTACVLGVQACDADGVFGACDGAELPSFGDACSSLGCPIDTELEVTLGHEPNTVEIPVDTPDGCAWIAWTSEPWLSISPDQGFGPGGTLTISATGAGATGRTGTIQLNGVVVTVEQLADSSPPTGAVMINGGAPATASSTVQLTLAAADPGGVAAMCLSNSATTCTGAWQPFAPTATHLLIGNAVWVFLRDSIGNSTSPPSSITDTIVVDKIAPSDGTVTAVASDARVDLSWTGFADAATGVVGYRLVAGTGPSSPPCTPPFLSEGSATSFAHTGVINGTTYRYRVCAVDGVGNVSSGATATARPAPELVPPTGSLVIAGGAAWATTTTVALAIAGSDASGVTHMCLSNSVGCASWTALAATATYPLSAGTGIRTVHLYLRDSWGNIGGPFSDDIFLDTSKPSNPALTATGSSGQIALSWTTSTDVGSGLAGYRLVSTVAPAAAPASCSVGTVRYEGPDTSFVDAGLPDGVARHYRVCAFDVAGGVSTGTAASTMPAPEYDAPIGTITIAGGAAVVGQAAVTVQLTGADASGVAAMCVSNTSSCSAWQPFAAQHSWTLSSGAGTKTVRLWLRDAWGTIGGPFTDTIGYDADRPVDGQLAASTSAPGSVALTWTAATDAHSGVASYKVMVRVGATPMTTCSNGVLVYAGPDLVAAHAAAAGQPHGYRVCAIDAVGNISMGTTASITP